MFARMMLLLSFWLAFGGAADAQQHRSTIRGTVLGPDGQPIAGVAMRAIHEDTGESRRFTTGERGRFTIVKVEPGSYSFRSDDTRFRDFIARARVKINDDIFVVLPLTAVSISSDVDYRSFAVDLDNDAANLRTRLPGEFLATLPLDGRSFFDALLLSPRLAGHPTGPRTAGTLRTNYWIDGFANTSTIENAPIVRPQIEAIEQFEAAVPVFDASFGNAGPVVNVLTRSGTNRLAAGAFGFTQTSLDRHQVGGFAGGPLVRGGTFLFADIQHTMFGDDRPMRDSGTDAGVRLDHVFDGARLTGRYAISDAVFFGRRNQLFGVSLRHAAGFGVNDVRLTATDRSGSVVGAPLDPRTYTLSDTFAWASGPHSLKAGAEWARGDLELVPEGTGGRFGAYIQDDWRPRTTVSVQAGVRIDWLDPPEAVSDARTHVTPRFGAVWQPWAQSATLVRAGYGRFAPTSPVFASVDAMDQWTIGVARQWGRTRTIEVAYEGSHVPDLGRFSGVSFEMEQRSEVGLTGHLTYQFGTMDFEAALPEDDADDRRHKLTGAFTWWLPLGDERRFFSSGVLQDIFGEMQLTGIFAMENTQTDPRTGRRDDFKTLDLGLLKNVRLSDHTLQLRFETFNTLNRPNLRAFFYPELLSIPLPDQGGRRYQLGARFLF